MKRTKKTGPTVIQKTAPIGALPSGLFHPDPDPPRGALTEGLNLIKGFRELEREGIFSQQWIKGRVMPISINDAAEQRAGMITAKEHGGADDYGTTLGRANRIWIVKFDTEQHREEFEENMPNKGREIDLEGSPLPFFAILGPRPNSIPLVPGIISVQPDIEFYLPFPELSQRWIEEFSAEVDIFLGRMSEESTNEISERLRTLISALAGCSSLDLTPTGSDEEGFRMLREHKEDLLQRLEKMLPLVDSNPDAFGRTAIVRKLILESESLATRATEVDAVLDHHLSGPNPVAFVEFIRGEVLKWKQDAASNRPPPNRMEQFIAPHGLARNARLIVEPWLVDRCEHWLERVEPTLNKDEDEKVPPEWITFDELLGVDAMKKVRQAIKDLGVTYVENKGKSRCIASLHAACDHFQREPKRNGHWPQMLGEFFGGYFSPNATKVHRSQWIDTYRVAYAAMKDKLEE